MKNEIKTKTMDVVIGSTTNENTGAVTLFFTEEKWGPVVTGRDLNEAKDKFIDALKVSLVIRSILETNDLYTKNKLGAQTTSEILGNVKKELERFESAVAA
jgi:hypothetical protein